MMARITTKTISAHLCTLLVILACTSFAYAKTNSLSSNSKEPLEITADGSLEWLRAQQKLVARKNALAKQGDASVAGEVLTALYREGKNGQKFEIFQVNANQNVRLQSRDSTVTGEKAVYNLDSGIATMTGNNLKMTAPDQTVTAEEKFEYWVDDGRVNALGNAKVIRPKIGGGTDTLQADKISAVLKENEQGEQVLHSLEAIGNVIITTPTEVVTGAYGIFKSDTNKAELTGGVKIKRGPNVLEGEKAIVNLTTNVSTLYGQNSATGAGDGRVRAVLYPDSE